MRSFVRRRQLIIFLVLTLVISWYPWYLGGHGLRTAGPSIAGLGVALVAGGWPAVKEMLGRLSRWRVPLACWAIALLGPPTLVLAAIGIHVVTGGDAPSFMAWRLEPQMVAVFMLILISPVGGAGGEEPFGWRGFAQPRLQARWGRWGPLVASLIIGTVWALWHLPEFFNPGSTQYAMGLAGMGVLVATEIANSIFMTWLFIKTGGSVLVAGVTWHLMIDTASTFFVDFTVTGLLSGETIPTVDQRLLATITIVMSVAALILAIGTRGRLGAPVDAPARHTNTS